MTAWFVDLKEEDLFLDDVIEACFENFFDPTFTKSFLRPDLVLVRRLAGQSRLKMSRQMIPSLRYCGIDAFGWLPLLSFACLPVTANQIDCSDGFVHPCKANWQASNEMD